MRVTIAIFALCMQWTAARVTFTHSVILDEFDFKGQSSLTVDGLCADTCRIYASITPESRKLTDNILIQTAKGFKTLSAVADLRDASTNQKLFLEINNIPILTIVNGNSGDAAGPLVIYIVNQAATYYGSAQVYEAEGLDRAPAPVQSITVLSARPFTITEASYAPMGVIARLAGFDALGYMTETCPNLYYLIAQPFPGFSLTINAPIVSLLYDVQQFHFPAGEIKATIGISHTNQMGQSGFINSPGYHGCTGKPAYRSSLYDMTSPILEQITDPNPQSISYDVVTNSDRDHALIVRNSAGTEIGEFSDTGDVAQMSQVTDKSLKFSWTPTVDTYFLVRYNSTA
ncbi:hypothetical protein PFISCL1PPCAC_12075 [Pristionchus fissidentatus]|uniref:Uncharacterized protein n=1 Tax=Pristionchus fissidentatus TaxID=1538716 RepID=A0AAV5VN00_9BILA|nr:hypothetical protein PFISCL1PPCAC_12075 [Pristionchus fissidentatus]